MKIASRYLTDDFYVRHHSDGEDLDKRLMGNEPSPVMLTETITKQLYVVAIAFVEFIQKQVKQILLSTLSRYQKNYNSCSLWHLVRGTSTGIAITSSSSP